jgi:hypothetical protein
VNKRKVFTSKITDPKSVEDALRKLVAAWDSLPPGEYKGLTGCATVNRWLNNQMALAIMNAKRTLGVAIPLDGEKRNMDGEKERQNFHG